MKTINLTIKLNVNDSMSHEEIANSVKGLLEEKISLNPKLEFKGISIPEVKDDEIEIKVIGRKISVEKLGAAAGYESRLWEKATC